MTTSDNISAIEAVEKAMGGVTPGPWKVFDGCSWRRIGTVGRDGNDCAVLAPTKASDGHPDLTCSRGNDLYANLNYIAACNPVAMSALLAEARKAEALKLEIAEKDARIAALEDELYDALQGPWPEWSEKILKLVRSYSGYDGYDDATDGVDLVGEVEEALSELYPEAERARTLLNGGSDAQG